jgi:hypothetical protein
MTNAKLQQLSVSKAFGVHRIEPTEMTDMDGSPEGSELA